MRLAWVTVVLAVLNVFLLAANGILLCSLDRLAAAPSLPSPEVASLRRMCAELASERVRLADKLRLLDKLIARLRATTSSPAAPAGGTGNEMRCAADPAFGEASPGQDTTRPDPLAIPVMTKEKLSLLRAKRSAMPPYLDDAVLLRGDIESIVRDRRWNREGRKLNPDERTRLAELVSQYRYFRTISPLERFRNGVQPELDRLREAGAYIEYPLEEGPPELDGLRISHAEPSDRPGFMRLYCFYPEDYPDLNHQEQVERERSLERFVQIYELLNGPLRIPPQDGTAAPESR